jgi:hypothetical protein
MATLSDNIGEQQLTCRPFRMLQDKNQSKWLMFAGTGQKVLATDAKERDGHENELLSEIERRKKLRLEMSELVICP